MEALAPPAPPHSPEPFVPKKFVLGPRVVRPLANGMRQLFGEDVARVKTAVGDGFGPNEQPNLQLKLLQDSIVEATGIMDDLFDKKLKGAAKLKIDRKTLSTGKLEVVSQSSTPPSVGEITVQGEDLEAFKTAFNDALRGTVSRLRILEMVETGRFGEFSQEAKDHAKRILEATTGFSDKLQDLHDATRIKLTTDAEHNTTIEVLDRTEPKDQSA